MNARTALSRDRLLTFFRDEVGADLDQVSDDASLLGEGVIDSILLLSLFTFLQRECGLVVDPREVTLANFDSISRILEFANRP